MTTIHILWCYLAHRRYWYIQHVRVWATNDHFSWQVCGKCGQKWGLAGHDD